jgi:hypothetical protein
MLPQGNWVCWSNPEGCGTDEHIEQQQAAQTRQHWHRYSKDAWRWLGWNAPSPDGKSITRYPMDYFVEDEQAEA